MTVASEARAWLASALDRRVEAPAREWLAGSAERVAGGLDPNAFCGLISQASRFAPRGPLAPDADELAAAERVLAGWNPERWSLRDAARAVLILSRADLEDETGAAAVEEIFRYADVGELCAAYRTLALLPAPERFRWRAGEGARTNMRVVFEATCCDTPYPVRWFDDVAWRQAVVKCLFVEAPLWRFHGLDGRIDAELARMALDLADERYAAGRRVYPELFLCLSDVADERGQAWIERAFAEGDPGVRCAAALAFARAGLEDRLRALGETEADEAVRRTIAAALDGHHDATAFRPIAADAADSPPA